MGFCVGVFDSGIGGLTVLRECALRLKATYYYLGDNGRAPYGSRSEEEITCFVREALKRFKKLGVDAAVLACNTATAVALEEMRAEFPFPIIGTEPAVLPAARVCTSVLVIATPRTAESARLKRLTAACPQTKFTVCGLEGFAYAIERAAAMGERVPVENYLPRVEGIDGVVLGCTHYSFYRDEIAKFYNLPVFDGNIGVAKQLVSLIERQVNNFRENGQIFGGKLGFLTTAGEREKNCNNSQNNRVVFLKPNKKCNQLTYKQMFA